MVTTPSQKFKKARKKKMKQMLSTSQRIKLNQPLEVWGTPDGSWKWEVYKKNQKDDDQPNASWFTKVKSPFTPEGELGDTYVKDIKDNAIRLQGTDEEDE